MSERPVSSRELRRHISRSNNRQEDSEWVALGHEESDSIIFGSHGSSSLLAGPLHFRHVGNQPPLRRVHGHRNLSALVPRPPTPIPRDVLPLRPRAGTVPATRISSSSSGLQIRGSASPRAQGHAPRRERNIFAPSSNGSSERLATLSVENPRSPENFDGILRPASDNRAVSGSPVAPAVNTAPSPGNYDWLELNREPARPLCLLGMSVPVLPPQRVMSTRVPSPQYEYDPRKFQVYLEQEDIERILEWLDSVRYSPPPTYNCPDLLSPPPGQEFRRSASHRGEQYREQRLPQHADDIHHSAVVITPPTSVETRMGMQRQQMQSYVPDNPAAYTRGDHHHDSFQRRAEYERQRVERERQLQHFEWLDRQARLRREFDERARIAEEARIRATQPEVQHLLSGDVENHIAEAINDAMSEGEAEDDGAVGVPGRPFVEQNEGLFRRFFRSL
ncbi:hypothetical protein FPQ18DRAFT_395457 [Pyronema domesticum]|uniref:Uncharacterized protein n=1 Tax=Pyronema omphalodes (strain CBS 100304) TaxID=1076935 RepID=U4KXM2_PYROM|nr:hypothetical protein FPQ18DRAFT_395457 [Pyronema domesticum]CCX06255.1 Protein of unknown function [Pyronema omphalodes CBS 100304]